MVSRDDLPGIKHPLTRISRKAEGVKVDHRNSGCQNYILNQENQRQERTCTLMYWHTRLGISYGDKRWQGRKGHSQCLMVWAEFFFLTSLPSNLGSGIKLIKLIKLANIFLIYYLLQDLVSAIIQQTLSSYVSNSIIHMWDLVANKWTIWSLPSKTHWRPVERLTMGE